jgi:hypothetical protein
MRASSLSLSLREEMKIFGRLGYGLDVVYMTGTAHAAGAVDGYLFIGKRIKLFTD